MGSILLDKCSETCRHDRSNVWFADANINNALPAQSNDYSSWARFEIMFRLHLAEAVAPKV